MKQGNKWYCIFFCAVLLAFCIANIATPQKAFSDNENRSLMQFPVPSAESILSGDFMSDFESYSTDQFICRDFFIRVKALSERASGKKENNGVYFAKNDFLIQKPPALDRRILNTNITALQKLKSLGTFDIKTVLVPTAYEIEREELPAYAYQPVQREITALTSSLLNPSGIDLIDPYPVLREHRQEHLYYRTDHHQTAYGGYYTYQVIAQALGITPYTMDAFIVREMSHDFYGTTWSEATLPDIPPDTIDLFEPRFDIRFTTEFVGENKKMDGLYDREALRQKDKYVMYLGGNHPITKVTSSLQNGKKLAVFKDSYAHNIVPFLANHYQEIHMIDPRYYNLDPVAYLQENKITDVLVLYSASNFASDTNLFKISAYLK